MSQGNLHPLQGTYYGHLHENALTDTARGLFWSVFIALDAHAARDSDVRHSVSIDWLRECIRTLPLTKPITFTQHTQKSAEATVYNGSHQWAKAWRLIISSVPNGVDWNAKLHARIDLEHRDGSTTPDLEIDGEVNLAFKGIIVVKQNLSEKPATCEEARALLRPYFGIDRRFRCDDEGWRFVFRVDTG